MAKKKAQEGVDGDQEQTTADAGSGEKPPAKEKDF